MLLDVGAQVGDQQGHVLDIISVVLYVPMLM